MFAGIDLAWTPHHESGLCILRLADGDVELLALEARLVTPAALAETLAVLGLDVVASIDAPLVVGPGRTAERLVARAFGRYRASAHSASEALLTSTGRDAGPRLAAELCARGFVLAPAALAARAPGRFAFETYPHAAHVTWFRLDERIPYKRKPGRTVEGCREALRILQAHLAAAFARELPAALPPLEAVLDPAATLARGAALKRLEDQLDAVTCVLGAFLAWRDGLGPGDVLGDGESGYVAVPGLRLDARFDAFHALRRAHAHELEHPREAHLRREHEPQPRP